MERSLVLVKPSGVSRKLVGEIISRFEKVGFHIKGMKMVNSSEEIINEHYKLSEEWARDVFEKSKAAAEKKNKEFPYTNHLEFSGMIQNRNKDMLRSGPIVALVVEGPHVIEIVRKMAGSTNPISASPGTIRGDFLYDSYELADREERAADTLIHASDSLKEAEREIKLWFDDGEIF
jgi:nucleoside-diphosphate kinase